MRQPSLELPFGKGCEGGAAASREGPVPEDGFQCDLRAALAAGGGGAGGSDVWGSARRPARRTHRPGVVMTAHTRVQRRRRPCWGAPPRMSVGGGEAGCAADPRSTDRLSWGPPQRTSQQLTSHTPGPSHSFWKEGTWKALQSPLRCRGQAAWGGPGTFQNQWGGHGAGRAEAADGDPPAWASLFSARAGAGFDLHPFPPLTSTCSCSAQGLEKVPGDGGVGVRRKSFRTRLKVKVIYMGAPIGGSTGCSVNSQAPSLTEVGPLGGKVEGTPWCP